MSGGGWLAQPTVSITTARAVTLECTAPVAIGVGNIPEPNAWNNLYDYAGNPLAAIPAAFGLALSADHKTLTALVDGVWGVVGYMSGNGAAHDDNVEWAGGASYALPEDSFAALSTDNKGIGFALPLRAGDTVKFMSGPGTAGEIPISYASVTVTRLA